ncbi:MAG: hypothetical protein APR63_03605 [Desulfuromonas sp. SDB]|nr:MAG: hypothetical protein APR63_03605 [Desulfuromonas sp. SDB]
MIKIKILEKSTIDFSYSSLWYGLLLSGLFALLTGISAQIKFFLPFTPVPLTVQTMVVLAGGALLGKKWGSLSQLIYIVLGSAVGPFFAGGMQGWLYLTGPTTGYLMGFLLAAYFVGYAVNRKQISPFKIFQIMLFANFVLIHLPGMSYLAYWHYCLTGTVLNPWKLLCLGSFPFILGDLIKISLAAGFSAWFIQKKNEM